MNDLQERQELFIKKASNNPHLKIIGEYINCETDVLCECVYCNENFKMKPERIYKNCMHQKCKNIFTANLRKERGYKKLLDTVGEDLELRTLFLDARDKGIIRSSSGIYIYGDGISLGGTADVVISWMKNPKNKKILESIKGDTYPDLEVVNPKALEKLNK